MLSVQSAEMVGPRWERVSPTANALLGDITPKLGCMCNTHSVVIRNRKNNNNNNINTTKNNINSNLTKKQFVMNRIETMSICL